MSTWDDESAEVQRRYFEEAEVDRFRWTTSAPGFCETEDDLLEPIIAELAAPCLEIGCGEGNNLIRFAARQPCTGVDLFPKKLLFASQELPSCRFAAAEAARLPFGDGVFGSVFVRDLLHHVREPRDVLAEVARVLREDGRFYLLEPNGRNPLIWLQSRIVPAEAGARKFSPESVLAFFSGLPFGDTTVTARQPMPLRRAILHYQQGFPSLGRSRAVRRLLSGCERWIGALIPRSRWTYIQVSARRTKL